MESVGSVGRDGIGAVVGYTVPVGRFAIDGAWRLVAGATVYIWPKALNPLSPSPIWRLVADGDWWQVYKTYTIKKGGYWACCGTAIF